jgi:hypothetical protein
MAAQQATPQDVLAAISAETAARQVADAALQGNVNAEILSRAQGDITLDGHIDSVRNIALGANVALVFDNKVQLDQWMAGAAAPGVSYTPADLRSGWKALIRAEDEPDLWWDGDASPPRWRVAEGKINLSAYRTANAQNTIDQALQGNINAEAAARQQADQALQAGVTAEANRATGAEADLQAAIDAEAAARQQADQTLQAGVTAEASRATGAEADLQAALTAEAAARQQADQTLRTDIDEIFDTYAPLESPRFTGIPETPRPDYSVPSQIADVYSILQLRDVLGAILRGARAAHPDTPLLPHIRTTASNRIRGVYA